MQLRYAFRVYPEPGQRIALARAFGCARVGFDDAVRAREDARVAGEPFPTAAALSQRLITRAKSSPERSWPAEVSSVVLQQALRDVEAAHRNFFASLKGERKGRKVGAPRTFVKIGRFEPTGQVCSACGHRDGPSRSTCGSGPVPPAAPGTTGMSTQPRM